ncbi:MAG: DoxX family protein [Bacteroidetes bacterium]|nr:DoxX family protein [Bacteroidota bacterium]
MKPTMFMARYEAQIYAAFRIVAGFLFLWHGSQKLFGFPPAGHEIPAYIMFIAGPVEFFGGLLILVGLWTPWVAFVCSGEMAFAYWSVHGDGTHQLLPLLNGGELAVIYCFLFLYIASKGSGLFSIDRFLEKRSQNRHQDN